MREIRLLDKLIDELAKGKAMEKYPPQIASRARKLARGGPQRPFRPACGHVHPSLALWSATRGAGCDNSRSRWRTFGTTASG